MTQASGVLQGRRALVTGSSFGIGRAIAMAFGRAGASVALNYSRHGEPAEQAAEEIRRMGVDAVALEADVAKPEDCESLFAGAVQRFGGLDIAVMNAGIQRDAPFAEMSLAQWQRVLDVNLTGAFLCAQQAVRQFRRQLRPVQRTCSLGTLIFISSVHQEIPWDGHANYAAAKGGLKLLMRTLAQELAPEGIRTNAIALGAIKTAINEPAWHRRTARCGQGGGVACLGRC
jgi:glucose 1-dehydrogenase